MARCFCSAVLLGLALSVGAHALAWTEPAHAQTTPSIDARQTVSDYVMRTREIKQGDFTLKPAPAQGGLQVYRVVVTADAAWIPAIERNFDVFVDSTTGKVTGEHSVRP